MRSKITLTAALVFSGCSLLKKRVEKTEKSEYRISTSGRTSISIENVSGKINVRNTADTLGFITITAVKSAEVKYDEQDKPIENIEILIDTSGSEVKIETEIRNNSGIFKKGKGGEVDYDIRVPANLVVKVENINGTITVTGVKNDVFAETVHGTISVFGSSGKLELTSVNGNINCNIDSVTKGVNVDVVNGNVKIGGLKFADAEVNASTVNGKVKVKDLNLTNIVSEKKYITGTLGKGGSPIQVSAVNGNITFDASKLISKKDDHFEFKIDFDDDEEELKKLEKILDDEFNDSKPRIELDTMKNPDVPGNADSLKKK
jgi:Putative adhesin